jgi:2'-5' RNA ligase
MRLFVALELPAPVVSALVGWGEAAARPGLRLLPADSLHVTLAFLGARPDEQAPALGEAVVACAAPVPGLALGGVAWLGRGSALALDLDDGDGACGRLQAAVAAAVGLVEDRPFRPHVTVARVRGGARVRRRGLPAPPDAGRFAGTALTLYESSLSPRGASYRRVASCALPSS